MVRDVVKGVLVKILMCVLLVSVLVFTVYLMFDFANSDIADAYANASTALGSRSVNVSKSQFKQEYEELLSGELLGSDSESYTGIGTKTDLQSYYKDNPAELSSSEVAGRLEEAYPGVKGKSFAIAYDNIMAKYDNVNLAIGVIANIAAEGNVGRIETCFVNHNSWASTSPEGSWGSYRFGEYLNNAGLYDEWDSNIPNQGVGNINCMADIELLSKIKENPYLLDDKGRNVLWSLGLGMAQWSAGRRLGLCELYKSTYANRGELNFSVEDAEGNLTDEFKAYVEAIFMMNELNGSYAGVVQECLSAGTAEECTKIICIKYEAPGNKEKAAEERAKAVPSIANVILGR